MEHRLLWYLGVNELMDYCDRFEERIMEKYCTTNTTVPDCFQELDNGLMAVGMKPDCSGTWQVLLVEKKFKEERDHLSVKEEAEYDNSQSSKARPACPFVRRRRKENRRRPNEQRKWSGTVPLIAT